MANQLSNYKEFLNIARKYLEENKDELFDVIDRYKIEIPNYDEANVSLEKDVGRMSEKLQKQKTTYAWHLQNCEGNAGCIDMVVSAFLKQVFEWDGSKNS